MRCAAQAPWLRAVLLFEVPQDGTSLGVPQPLALVPHFLWVGPEGQGAARQLQDQGRAEGG